MAQASPYALLPDAEMYAAANLNEEKDSSKNLVSGDFEREFRVGMVQKPSCRRRAGAVALTVAVAVSFVWLLGLTVLRELQLNKLRQEVDQLSANMIAMEATVKNLNQKFSDNRVFDDFKNLEDTIYADEVDDDGIPVDESNPKKTKPDLDAEKLDGLTVLEDDDDDDEMNDDDDEDYADEQSGDYYSDYDGGRRKPDKTNMLKLEDLTGSVVTLGKDKDSSAKIREIKRMLNENPEMPDIALAAFSPPAAPVAHAAEEKRVKRSVFGDSPLDSVDEFAAPRAISKPDERRVPKKYSSAAMEESKILKLAAAHASRIARHSDDEFNEQRRPFIAAHFHGNTSHLNTDIHEHYKGNGLVRVSHGAHHDVWYPSPWTLASPQRPTLTHTGHVHVHHTGVYLVYVQIYYLDSHDVISWVLHRTNPEIEGRETLLQCAQSTHSAEQVDKPNSCFSASALYLRRGDKLAVRNTGGSRHSLMQPEKSFIGLVQLADTVYPDQEL